MSVSLSPIFNGWQGFTSGGLPLNSGQIFTYIAGGTTPQNTFTTSAGNVANGNPIVLGPDGRPPNEIWLTDGAFYRFDLEDSLGNLIKTYDNIGSFGANATTGTGAVVLQNTPTLITPNLGAATGSSVTVTGTVSGNTGTFTNLSSTIATGSTITGGTFSDPIFTNQSNTTQALTDGATISWNADLGSIATVTIAGNRTMAAPTNLKAGGIYFLRVTQDGTGNRTLTWNAVFKGPTGAPMPQPALVAASLTQFVFGSDGTSLFLIAPVYSKGTWTPTVGGNATYNTQTGIFIKIDEQVYIQGTVAINVLGTGSATTISGLPFNPNSSISQAIPISDFSSIGTSVVFLTCFAVSTGLGFKALTAAAATITTGPTIFQNNASVTFSGVYTI